jgi:hypothetical protein
MPLIIDPDLVAIGYQGAFQTKDDGSRRNTAIYCSPATLNYGDGIIKSCGDGSVILRIAIGTVKVGPKTICRS